MKSSGIGGQAVMEGVMMKNQDTYSVAVRKPDGTIEIKKENYQGLGQKYSFARLPIIRGVVAFAESMVIGMKTLTYSASFYEEEEAAKPGKMEETFGKVFKEKTEAAIMAVTVCISVLLAVGIFMILPFFIAEFFQRITDNTMILALIEGLIRIGIFIAYVGAISQMQDIKRVFMYHGAEHKTINCVESGKELTVANVKACSKHHKRCGTSFMLIVMVVSIIFFLFIRVENMWIRMLLRVLLVPAIAGVSYEFIRLAGRSDALIIRILSKPGMWLQALTTREPDDSMMEVAIVSVEAVFDWRTYQKEAAKESKRAIPKPIIRDVPEEKVESVSKEEVIETERNVEDELFFESKEAVQEPPVLKSEMVFEEEEAAKEEIAVSREEPPLPKKEVKKEAPPIQQVQAENPQLQEVKIKSVRKVVDIEEARRARRRRERQLAAMERTVFRLEEPEEEDDEILKALDRFFVFKGEEDDDER